MCDLILLSVHVCQLLVWSNSQITFEGCLLCIVSHSWWAQFVASPRKVELLNQQICTTLVEQTLVGLGNRLSPKKNYDI